MKDLVLHFDLGLQLPEQRVRSRTSSSTGCRRAISLAIGAAVVWLLAGITVGVISAVRSRTALDRVTMGLALVAISAPVYWLGLVALFLFSNDIGAVPPVQGRRQLRAVLARTRASGSSR